MKAVDEERAFKNLFDEAHLERVARAVARVHRSFDAKGFRALMPSLRPLPMKSRVRLIRDELHARLPTSYPEALALLMRAVEDADLSGFDLWPVTEFVQTHGLAHVDVSLAALERLTRRFTAEWAVRPFLEAHPERTLAFLARAARSDDVAVRRWASEGTRPRLPWGARLQAFIRDPSPTLAILELLKHDDEPFVRKSVANHVNDVSKDHPARAVTLLAGWQKAAGAQHRKKIDWIVRHALRTLIKAGDPAALALVGVTGAPAIGPVKLRLARARARVGESLGFAFDVRSRADAAQRLVIDYRVHYVRANGSSSAKVFKLKTVELAAREALTIEKELHLREVTTREHYDGTHVLDVQINGRIVAKATFELTGGARARKQR